MNGMNRWIIRILIGLMLLSFAVMLLIVVVSMSSPGTVLAPLSSIFCPKASTLTIVTDPFDSTHTLYQCIDIERQMVKDVSAAMGFTIIGLVLLPFVFLLLAMLVGIQSRNTPMSYMSSASLYPK